MIWKSLVVLALLLSATDDANAQAGSIFRALGKAVGQNGDDAARAAAKGGRVGARGAVVVAGAAAAVPMGMETVALARQAAAASEFKFSAVSLKAQVVDASVSMGPRIPSAIVQIELTAIDVSQVFEALSNSGIQLPPDRQARESLAVEYAALAQAGYPRIATKVCTIDGNAYAVPSRYDICPDDSIPRFRAWLNMPAIRTTSTQTTQK